MTAQLSTPAKDSSILELSTKYMSNSPEFSLKPQLQIKLQPSKIRLEVTEKLQAQMRWLCEKVWQVEWSATLFYTTEGGNFGDPEFKVIGQELYLQDIGSEVYTEYTFGADYVKMMMDYPHLRKMKKGHLHSHNNMGVFFSGTDTTELHTNSEFHNYYVSLIVNNKNEMVAQVAHRVFKSNTTTNRVSYKNTDGLLVEEVTSDSTNNDCIVVYDCEVIKPFKPDALLRTRFRGIRDEKNAKNNKLHEGITSPANKSEYYGAPKEGSRNFKKDDFNSYLAKGVQQEIGLFNNDMYQAPSGSAVDGNIREFMIAFIGKGVLNQTLSQVLGNLNRRLKSNTEIEVFLKEIAVDIVARYYTIYNDDPMCVNFDQVITMSMQMLNRNYAVHYANLVQKIINKLKTLKNNG